MPDTLGVTVAVAAIARSPWTSQRCFVVSPNSLLVNREESEQSASASDSRWMRFLRTSCVQPLQQAARGFWCFSSGEKVARLVNAKRDPNNSLLETTTAWNAKTVYWDSRYLRESQHWAHRETTVATVPFVDSAAKLSLFAVNMCKGNGCLLNAILGGMVCIRWYQMQALQPQHLPEICRSLTGFRVSRWKGCWHNVDITHCYPPIVLLQHPRLQKSKTSPRHHVWKDPRIWIGWMMGKSWKIFRKTPEFMVNKIYHGFL